MNPEDIDIAAVAAQAPVAWAVTDLDGRHVMGNAAYAALFGRAVDELVGLPVRDLAATDTPSPEVTVDRLVAGNILRHESDQQYLRADGSPFTGHLVASLLRDDDGEPLAIVRVVADVSHQREESARLARSQDRLATMITNISDTVTLVDGEGRVISTTGFHKEVLGYPRGFWRSSSIFELAHPDDQAESERLAATVLAEPGVEVSGEFRARHASGHHEVLEISAVNLLDDPSVGAVVVTSRNVSQRKEAERELAAMRDRALALADERANFVANVSHELRAPLHAVLGLAELLADRVEDAGQSELVAGIRREADQLRFTVDDLLDYSRFEAHGVALEVGPVDLEALVDGVVQRASATNHAAGLTVRSSLAADVPTLIEGDAHRLDQLLTNLVSNAVKFTTEGAVTLTVTSNRPGRVIFEVRDTGPGIPASHRDLVFEPFVQVPGRPSVRGTGLGLALVRALIDLMGGEVTLDCPAEGGTIVRVDLPAAPTDRTDEVAAPAVGGPNGRAASVLVVEDNEVNQLLVRQQLDRLGHRSTIVGNATDGLAILTDPTHGHDLVLMDWQLPDIDGLEATRRLRVVERTSGSHIPVIAMTASAMPEDRAASRAAGMDDFLAKPVGLHDLRRMIDRWTPASSVATTADEVVAGDGGSLDPRALETLVDDLGDRAVVTSVVEHYLSELDDREQAISDAVASGDHDVLHRVGHTLRSTSAMMGVFELRDLCRHLEATAPETDTGKLLERFLQAAARARVQLRAWIDEGTGVSR